MSQTLVTLAITGASGVIYGVTLLERLLAADRKVALVVSKPAMQVIEHELELDFSTFAAVQEALRSRGVPTSALTHLSWYSVEDFFTPIASGSSASDQMLISPCTMATLGAIASGAGYNLIHRAADVMLKEGKKLILMPRETPYSAIHLDNMGKLVRAGAEMIPLSPSFYHHPKTIADLVDSVVDRALNHLGIDAPPRSLWYLS